MNDSKKNIVSNDSVQFIASGDANFYRVINGNQWIAAIQFNGEFSAGEQEAMLQSMVESLSVKPCEETTTKTYLVKLYVQAGEYEKSAVHLVVANNESEAVDRAIEDEAHSEPIEEGRYTYEDDYSFGYSLRSVTEVDPQDIAVLNKYL